MMLLRQLASIVLLPGMIAVVVPSWIAWYEGDRWTNPASVLDLALVALGAVLLALGLTLFVASLHEFWSRGRGTLAPWDPPRQFVVSGPYRFVRNPMISGVIFVLFAEATLLRSWSHALWAAGFALSNVVYLPMFEEPQLAARFGEPYRIYQRAVRRFIPRLTPWNGGA